MAHSWTADVFTEDLNPPEQARLAFGLLDLPASTPHLAELRRVLDAGHVNHHRSPEANGTLRFDPAPEQPPAGTPLRGPGRHAEKQRSADPHETPYACPGRANTYSSSFADGSVGIGTIFPVASNPKRR